MTYELAKKLKEAGFPQKLRNGKFFYWVEDGEIDEALEGTKYSESQMIAIPTLEELIEACGEGLHMISKFKNGHRSDGWYAMGTTWLSSVPMYFEASTPIEAVANLWLALNEK